MKTFAVLYTLLTFLFADTLQAHYLTPPADRSMSFSSDVAINNKPSENQRNVRSASAFNGWLYVAYTINDTSNKRGGIYVGFSKDHGLTWAKFVTYVFNNSFYSMTDIAVAGTDTSNLDVYLAGVNQNTAGTSSTLYVDKFDGRNGTLTAGQIFVHPLGSRTVTDISLASDYLYPMAGASPYSIALLYTTHGASKDSLFFALSGNGGKSFAKTQTLSATNECFRKITLGYGKSASVSGSYYAAWELMGTSSSKLGHIFTAHSGTGAAWSPGICLDSLSLKTLNLVCHPSIACQYSNINNDSSGLTCLIAFETAAGGNLKDMNVIGCYNKRASSGNTWNAFSVAATSENDMQPNVSYDQGESSFLITYYDSTDGHLPFATKDLNMAAPNAWNFITTQYNDQSENLKSPSPRILLNPTLHMASFVWISDNANLNGSVLFDSQYAGIATQVQTNSEAENNIAAAYPNPASDRITIPISLSKSMDVNVTVYDMLGNEVNPMEIIHSAAGASNAILEVNRFCAGVYFCRVQAGTMNRTLRFVVSR